jgi:hypothetical protein
MMAILVSLRRPYSGEVITSKRLFYDRFACGDGAGSVAPAGATKPHNNLMPYLTFYFCIALQGVFPATHISAVRSALAIWLVSAGSAR